MALKNVKGTSQKKSRSFVDLAIGMSKNSFTDDAAIVKNDNAIKQAVKNLVMTVPGEKPFAPSVGSQVSQLLFEPFDSFTSDAIKEELINTITNFEPRVSLTLVDVRANFERNTFDVTIEYTIVGIPIVESIEFVLQRPE